MKFFKRKALRAAGLLCAALGAAGVLPGRAASMEAAYDAVTGATAITPPPSVSQPPISAKLKTTAGNRAKGSFTGTLSARKGQFRGTLKLSLPDAGSGITDAFTAQAADLVVELARRGQTYARCDLFFVTLTRKPRAAKFALAVMKRNGSVQQQTGFCELTVPPFGPGLPTPLAHDALTLKAITADGEHLLATGVFAKQ